MQTNSFVKIGLCVNFEKFPQNVACDQLQSSVLDLCDWSYATLYREIFSPLRTATKISGITFVCIRYHLCEILTQITECLIFNPYYFLQ